MRAYQSPSCDAVSLHLSGPDSSRFPDSRPGGTSCLHSSAAANSYCYNCVQSGTYPFPTHFAGTAAGNAHNHQHSTGNPTEPPPMHPAPCKLLPCLPEPRAPELECLHARPSPDIDKPHATHCTQPQIYPLHVGSPACLPPLQLHVPTMPPECITPCPPQQPLVQEWTQMSAAEQAMQTTTDAMHTPQEAGMPAPRGVQPPQGKHAGPHQLQAPEVLWTQSQTGSAIKVGRSHWEGRGPGLQQHTHVSRRDSVCACSN